MNNVHNRRSVPEMYRALCGLVPKSATKMQELGEYPVTVVHSLRESAGIAPEHPLISERARGDWRCSTRCLASRRRECGSPGRGGATLRSDEYEPRRGGADSLR